MSKPKIITKQCKRHGSTEYVLETRGFYRCKKCRVYFAGRNRKKLRIKAVDYLGGECSDCGYTSEYIDVYDFHHVNPKDKLFNITISEMCRSWKVIEEELNKCVLLCANCHRLRHAIKNGNVVFNG